MSFPKVNTPTLVRLILHLMVTLGSGTRMTNAILLRPTPTSGMGTRREMDTCPPSLVTDAEAPLEVYPGLAAPQGFRSSRHHVKR